MKLLRYFFLCLFVFFLFMSSNSGAYLFGIKSGEDSYRFQGVDKIKQIENKYKIRFDLVSFIFDGYNDETKQNIEYMVSELGTNRIFHIAISPQFTAKEVADGKFDAEYLSFFKLVKKYDIKVIFRTMHEMNGGRYLRSSDPENFKKAWIRMYNISRLAGLDQKNLLLDFSVNHRDMPTKSGLPSQTSELIKCSVQEAKKTGCYQFENYYPGDKYVDIIGFSFYNWGKGNGDRLWKSPKDILYDQDFQTLPRLKNLGKPLIIDEVASSSVRYTGAYALRKSKDYFDRGATSYLKEDWIKDLTNLVVSESQIKGMVYMNIDKTSGYQQQLIGEADRVAIDPSKKIEYKNFFKLFLKSDYSKSSYIYDMFGICRVYKGSNIFFVNASKCKDVQNTVDMVLSYLLKTKQINSLDDRKIDDIAVKYIESKISSIKKTDMDSDIRYSLIGVLKSVLPVFGK